VKSANAWWEIHHGLARAAATDIENKRLSRIGTFPALDGHSRSSGSEKGRMTMMTTLSIRDAAVSIPAAFVSAMLFVSAATGPLPLA
jgi:hypothetical protein